ncbi:MAG TPA: histidine kinase dimerization/phosphoacceptor domain -containing protein [Bryobacteraceae bacterium]|nr:histidine kinase dimerization/phosphoacceptor domain -containing protein [Bryobacteraceae bacterium]
MPEKPPLSIRLLILEDRPEDAELMVHELRRGGFDPDWRRVETELDFLAQLAPPPDVILADYTMPMLDAHRALELLEGRGLSIPFIVVSGSIGEDSAVAMMRQGASDYLLKDRLGRLSAAVKHALLESRLQEEKHRTENELAASEARFDAFMRHLPAVAFIQDESGRLLYVNHESDREAAAQLRQGDMLIPAGSPSQSVEEITADGRVRQMLAFRFLFHDAAGHPLLGGVSVDITEQKAIEMELSKALAAKDVLLREVHHRVKNNLQTISSLLHMQADGLPGAAASQALHDAQRRVHSMALIHEQMYGDKDMDVVDFGGYAQRLARDLIDSFGSQAAGVQLRFATDPVYLAMDQMIPCGLILNELITNCLKYAFPAGRGGQILVAVRETAGTVTLTVADNGVGLPTGGAPRRTESLGMRIVAILTAQLGGAFAQTSGNGVRSTVTFGKSDRLNPDHP